MTAAAEALPSRALAMLKALGPYAAIELLLPGGSLVALVLWLYRRYKAKKATTQATGQTSGSWISFKRRVTFWTSYETPCSRLS